MLVRTSLSPRPISLQLLLVWLLALLLAGCAGLPSAGTASLERAQEFTARGEHALAAQEYERLAERLAARVADQRETEASRVPRLWLDAAAAWLRAARPAEADRALARLTAPGYQIPLSPALLRERETLRAESAALGGDAARAWALFSALEAPTESEARKDHFARRQAFAAAADQPLEAIRAARAREATAGDAAQKSLVYAELLVQLRAAVERGARLDPRTAGRDALARGWLEAAPLAARAAQLPSAAATNVTADWRKRYPNHPAATALAATHRTALPRASTAPADASAPSGSASVAITPSSSGGKHVAALLPLSGRNAAAGRQLRDGMLAAHYLWPANDMTPGGRASGDRTSGDRRSGDRLPLRFYDTNGVAITELLQRAERAGAVFVIGPLAREDVIAAAEDARALPTLALNFLPSERTSVRAGFYQFALSPEQEARAIARQALAQGQRRAVALVPAGDWGERVLGAFESTLSQGGGSVIARASLSSDQASAAIEQALRLDQSRARHRRLQSILDTPLAFQPRRRGDVDLLFVPGGANALRELRPQLRFHGAADIPSYTTSDAWDGRATSELTGLVFPDTRWMLDIDEPTTRALRETVRTSFGTEHDRHRLFAFGHDAWLLQQRLRQLRGDPDSSRTLIVEGATGRLELDAEGRIQRSLEWAEFIEGGIRAIAATERGREP